MVKINRPIVGLFGVFVFLLSCWLSWVSLSGYLSFFKLNDVIIFSWKVGVFIFGTPLLFYFSYLALLCVIKNKVPTMNNKLANSLTLLAMFGAIISLFFSIYIGHNLQDSGYKVCSKTSWVAPNEYVKDLKLCP
ncbi:DUF1240 domain-containing protein [Serratia fonticola]|uniref:DUF1240 domain-containing protein n=1 Tax=Serratia fonticola TaxID=47917 RepID=UPI00093ED22F|nr:DUF1240 domain-containing protein [Serratia fonticola]OKP26717.1 hypothetical protein BSQ40_17855 [Serratia fonticola]